MRDVPALLTILAVLAGAISPARAADGAALQRQLDDLTRHDLCARDDAQLRRLNRALGRAPVRSAVTARTR